MHIDCDAAPFVPAGLTLEEHKKGGQFAWDPHKVQLYLSEQQTNGSSIDGYGLRKVLKDQPVLNANVLDCLFANPHLIPRGWKDNDKYIYFWGTVYSTEGDLCVRFLYRTGGGWNWDYFFLNVVWDAYSPAAILASRF